MPVMNEEQLQSLLDDIAQRLRAALSPQAIYFFGSYAEGRPSEHSDLDLLVVIEDSPLNAYQRDAQAYRALRGLRVPIDVLVYTREEFDRRSALPVSFEHSVKKRGRPIYAA